MGLHGLLRGYFKFYIYMDLRRLLEDSLSSVYEDVCTSQETQVWNSTTCYDDSFIFVYAEDVNIPREGRIWATRAFYRDSFAFYI
jgi:hypothetical protein